MASSDILHVSDADFDTTVAEGVVLVDMWAPWCAPCMMQGPILEKVADVLGDKAKIAKLNVDEGQASAGRFGVQAIPTLLILKDGVEYRRFVGVQGEETLVSALNDALNS